MLPINPIYDRSSLPREFDARSRWPGKISPPKDQGWCGASWAFSTVAVSSDRFAIALDRLSLLSNRLQHFIVPRKQFFLSSQHLVKCNTRQHGCQGGYLTRAWNFVRKFGYVDCTIILDRIFAFANFILDIVVKKVSSGVVLSVG